jgi:hypothetical protein
VIFAVIAGDMGSRIIEGITKKPWLKLENEGGRSLTAVNQLIQKKNLDGAYN